MDMIASVSVIPVCCDPLSFCPQVEIIKSNIKFGVQKLCFCNVLSLSKGAQAELAHSKLFLKRVLQDSVVRLALNKTIWNCELRWRPNCPSMDDRALRNILLHNGAVAYTRTCSNLDGQVYGYTHPDQRALTNRHPSS
jgi:hypothetical protein